jgi:hypothetical protein
VCSSDLLIDMAHTHVLLEVVFKLGESHYQIFNSTRVSMGK